jgi:putative tryptophan/tyrosine transport system substrate-binding protein
MNRRAFITLFGGAAVAWPSSVRAQREGMPVVGFLGAGSAAGWNDFGLVAAFHKGLREAGFVDGQNLKIEWRWADGQYDRLPALASELVRQQVAVIAAGAPIAVRAAMRATTSIPIVFAIGSDPVRDKFVRSLGRPEGNVTGATMFGNLLSAKRLDLFHRLVPDAGVIGLLLNPKNANAEFERLETEQAVRSLGLQFVVHEAASEQEIDQVLARLVQQRTAALAISGDSLFSERFEQIARRTTPHRIPTACPYRQQAAAGCLMSYGTIIADAWLAQGLYVGRVLKGEKLADLPVLQPTRFEFIVNVGTARSLGLTIPPALLSAADDVIE